MARPVLLSRHRRVRSCKNRSAHAGTVCATVELRIAGERERRMLDTLLEKANNLPLLPGVYIMLDDKGEVIYVGKAKKLKNQIGRAHV